MASLGHHHHLYHDSPITASLAGADTRLSWRLTLLEVTPHCQRPSSSPGSASITRRLQSPVTCTCGPLIGQLLQRSLLIGHLTVLCHHIFPTEQSHWLHILLPPVSIKVDSARNWVFSDLHWLVSPMFWMTQASLAPSPGLTNTSSG